jgi:hypothetical protein
MFQIQILSVLLKTKTDSILWEIALSRCITTVPEAEGCMKRHYNFFLN